MANCIRCGRQMPGFSFGKKICQWCVQHEAYQRGELAENAPQPVMRAPWARRGQSSIGLTQIIFGINAAVFIAMVLASGTVMDFPIQDSIRWGANYGPLTLSGEWWRLLTNVFMHGGLIHIAFNMWCLWNLGALCEALYGAWTYAGIYLICGVGASLASVAWHPNGPSVGASGAIFGLAGALIAAFKLGEFSVPRSALSGTLRSLGAFVVYNLIFGQLMPGIDNTAHIGGLATGLIVGALVALLAPHQEHAARRIAIFLFGFLLLAGVAAGVARHYGFPLHFGKASLSGENPSGHSVAKLENIVKQRPDFAPARFDLAQAYFSQGDYAKAEAQLKRALELQPQNADARTLLGMVYFDENRAQDAKDAFEQAISQDANNGEAHFGFGLALAAEGNHPAAVEEFKTAARLAPGADGVNYNLGVSYAKLKRYDDAIAAFLEEKKISGDGPEVENALADAYQANGLSEKADDARSKAAQFK